MFHTRALCTGIDRLVLCGVVALATLTARGDDQPSIAVLREVTLAKCQIKIVDRTLVAAERDGVISDLTVRVGDRVKKDQLLMELKHEIATASAALAEARAASDVNVRFSAEVLKTAKEEYESSLDLKRQDAISDQQFRQRRMEYERSRLSLEQSEFEQTLNGLAAKQSAAELTHTAYWLRSPGQCDK